jgi:glycosyltransferase involved in cell wall biosynthesis
MKCEIIVVQAVIPDYRIGLFQQLAAEPKVRLVAGDEYFTVATKTAHAAKKLPGFVHAKNRYFLSRKAMLQTWPGMFQDLCANSTRVVELNPRCITSWLSLLFSKVLRRGRTVVWGHLLNRAGEVKTFSARQLMLQLANGALFYTHGQQQAFLATNLGHKITSGYAPNAVVYTSQVRAFTHVGQDFIYVGRLVADKKPLLLVQAFIRACALGLAQSQLHIVGTGELAEQVKQLAAQSPVAARIHLYGHNNDYDFLASLYQQSVCSVSPGYVGLSVTQSFSFGRPMLISKDEPHAPEIEAFKPGANGHFFETDQVEALALQLLAMYQQREFWAEQAPVMATLVRENYTYEAMAKGYLDLIERVELQ